MREHTEAKKGQGDERAGGARSDGGPAPTTAARHRALRDLQQTAGNAAVAGVVQRFDWRDIADPFGVTSAIGGVIGFVMSGAVNQGDFKQAVHSARQRPIWRAEWDAWGHAVCGACSAGFGGSGHAWLFGSAHELISELGRVLHISEHDSYREDTYNQAVGRAIAQRGGMGSSGPELIRACTQAYLGGQMLVGPAREDAWLPYLTDTQYAAARRHENRYWVPNHSGNPTGNPSEWAEAVDPGERGQARGTGAHPHTPLPAEH
jgi:hypothetical protein